MSQLFIQDKSIAKALEGVDKAMGRTTVEVVYEGDCDQKATIYVKQTQEIGRAVIETLYNQPWVSSADLYVHEDWRGKGVAELLDRLKVAMCRDSNKRVMIASVWGGNVAEMKRVLNAGWKSVNYAGEHHLFIKPL